MNSLIRLLAVSLILFSGAVSSTVIRNVDGTGQLLGASNVDVGGVLYDVEFVAGTCTDLFNGCDELSDFAFNTLPSAQLAVSALMDTVLIDTVDGLFDSDPSLTNGCSAIPVCFILTPYEFINIATIKIVGVRNALSEPSDSHTVGGNAIGKNENFAAHPFFNYARWSPSEVSDVPEPSTLIIFCLGLIGLARKYAGNLARPVV
ncbi:PEP-CTERM sorting domain-containing protein [Photobacterium makurazakiensis]|uniref:PEP-CTERM sorting domain-containing protein n=1 Tax=Photobacterium makurazakiensis TaxID=2910234 RepID=UPI003D0FAF35